MYLEDKYFHSVKSNCFNTSGRNMIDLKIVLLKLERIFKERKVLCRSEINKIYPNNHYYSYVNHNKDDLISLSKHIKKKNSDDEDERHVIMFDENAYEMYPFSNLSLVFNEKLFKECILIKDGIRIPMEVQVKGNVDLKYLDAISIPVLPSIEPFFSDSYDLEVAIRQCNINPYYYTQLEQTIKLMEKYNIDVPIVDIITGNEYRENDNYKRLIKEGVNKI